MSTAPAFPLPSRSGPGHALCATVDDLTQVAFRLREVSSREAFAALTDQQAGRVAVALADAAETAQAATAVALGRVADSGLPAVEGFVTPGSWWRAKTRLGKDDANDEVRLARRLRRHYAATVTAWTCGSITGTHAELIATGIDGVLNRVVRAARRDAARAGEPVDRAALDTTIEQVRAALEAELLTLARDWGPETLRVALEHARLAADPDGASQAQLDAENDARVKLVEVGDLAVLTAHVTKELAAKLRTVLDHYRDQLHHRGDGADARAKGKAASDTSGKPSRKRCLDPDDVDPVTGDPIVRSNAQRDAAALAAWVDATLDGGLGNSAVSERPHLDVTVTLADLANGTGSAVLERTGTPVPAATAARIACDAGVRVVLVDGQYRDPHTGAVLDPALAALRIAGTGVLDYGRAQRIVPPRLRRLLGHRDRGCAFPGCHRPPQHCQAHHVRPWEHGGETSLANTVLLCSRHHHFVHEGGWRMVARDDIPHWQPGHWRFVPPPRTARL